MNPYTDALALLSETARRGVTLTRPHVEVAAKICGARFDILWDTILAPRSNPRWS